MALNLDALLINAVLSTIFIAPVLWLSGRAVVGSKKARFVDALLIAIVGTIVGGIFSALFSGIIAAIIQLIIWLALIRYYYECGWGTAFGIAVLAIMIFVVIALILGVIGFTLFSAFFI